MLLKDDLTTVEIEMLRPLEWIERHGIEVGKSMQLHVPELGIARPAEIVSIGPCPPIAEGEVRVVTARFVTRDPRNLVRVTLANGTEIRAIDVHPVWSLDREEWVPAGKLEPGEHVDTLTGPVAVTGVERIGHHPAVYNLEVHGEHVYRIAVDGVLVHNAGPSYTLGLSLTDDLADFAKGARAASWQAGHIVPWGNFSNRLDHVQDALQAAKKALRKAGVGLNDSWNGFWTNCPTHRGTHRNEYLIALGEALNGKTNRQEVLNILSRFREQILSGEFLPKCQ